MAIADYTTLVAAIKRYAARSDLTFSATIPDFVGFAEDRLYNGHSANENDPLFSQPVRTAVMEATDMITVTDGVGTLPDDYLSMRKISRSGDTLGLKYLPPERIGVESALEGAGVPLWYTIAGLEISLVPVWAGALSILYYRRFPAVTDAAPTGNMIASHGLAYLEACLIEAFSFMQEPDLAIGHAAKLRGIVSGLNRSATDLRYSGPLRVRQRVWVP